MKYNKKARYSIIKLVLRVLTLGIATTALIIALQNRGELKWMEKQQDLMIELGLFPKV